MSFDKKEYWHRRTGGLRGQGEYPKPKLLERGRWDEQIVSEKPVGKKALKKNTKRARKAQLNA